MEFGIFMEFETRVGESHRESFRSAFELVDAAEAWGLDTVWLGEMHFTAGSLRAVRAESSLRARWPRGRRGSASESPSGCCR